MWNRAKAGAFPRVLAPRLKCSIRLALEGSRKEPRQASGAVLGRLRVLWGLSGHGTAGPGLMHDPALHMRQRVDTMGIGFAHPGFQNANSVCDGKGLCCNHGIFS